MKRRTQRRLSQAELVARLPRALRAPIPADTITRLGLCHFTNFEQLAAGDAPEELLWHFAGAVLQWRQVASMINAGLPEMEAQLALVLRMVEQFGRTGRVYFADVDLELARDGVDYMDHIATLTDHATAEAAALMAQQQVVAMRQTMLDFMAAEVAAMQGKAA